MQNPDKGVNRIDSTKIGKVAEEVAGSRWG